MINFTNSAQLRGAVTTEDSALAAITGNTGITSGIAAALTGIIRARINRPASWYPVVTGGTATASSKH